MSNDPRRIKADGKKSAKIVLIGECGGRDEAIKLRPFVGWSGRTLASWWSQVGLSRSEMYIDNVYPFTPPMKYGAPRLELVHPDDLKFWAADLHERLSELSSVNVIVPTGEMALKAITGLKGITKYRGSILAYKDKIKVIPTLHPAFTARRPTAAKACLSDWRRIAIEAKTSEIQLPQREHFTHPTLNDLGWYIDKAHGVNDDVEVLSIDCEWSPTSLLCVGFSYRSDESFTIPTTADYWKNAKDLREALSCVRALCKSDIPKVLHHGHSDAYVLRRLAGISINNYVWDTLALHHALDPNSEHDLAYLASIYTRQPYWKDEAKDAESIAKYASQFDALLRYNGIDAAVTRELFDILHAELERRDMVEFYHDNYSSMFEPMIDMMLCGIRVNTTKRIRRQAQLQSEIITIQDKISAIIGETCYAKKSLKNASLMAYFHDVLKLPKVMRVRKKKGGEKVKTASLDEVVIRRYMLKYESAKELGQLVLDHRRKYVLMNQYGDSRIDSDGRMRSTYSPYADSGRFRCSEAPLGTGANAQNVDRETRDIYVPDNF